MHLNVFAGKTYKYILTGDDVASRYKIARVFRTRKANEAAFVLEAKFKYIKVFQFDNG